jgi:hypothetical protein
MSARTKTTATVLSEKSKLGGWDDLERLDQEARKILLENYRSQRQHWGIVLTSIVLMIFSVSEAREVLFFGSYLPARIACGILATAACYTIVNIYWYSFVSSPVLRAAPETREQKGPANYLTRLEYGVMHEVRKNGIANFVSLIIRGKMLEDGRENYKREVFIPLGVAIVLEISGIGMMDKYVLPELQSLGLSPLQAWSIAVLCLMSGEIVFIWLAVLAFRIHKEAVEQSTKYYAAAKDNESIYKTMTDKCLFLRMTKALRDIEREPIEDEVSYEQDAEFA